MARHLKMMRTDDGMYYAYDVQFPQVIHPESFGSKAKCEAYIASWHCLTVKEYRDAKKRGRIK